MATRSLNIVRWRVPNFSHVHNKADRVYKRQWSRTHWNTKGNITICGLVVPVIGGEVEKIDESKPSCERCTQFFIVGLDD